MKKFCFILLAMSLLSIPAMAEVTLAGKVNTIDTLAYYQVGPGTWYLQLRMALQESGKNRRDVYILQVDRRNPYVSVQTVLSNDSVEKGEQTSSMAIRKSKPGKRYFAGTNGDWWSTTRPGVPEGAFVADNTIAITPMQGRAPYAMCAIDQNDSLYFGHDFFTDVYLQTDNDTVRCNHVNDIQYDNELVLYNFFNGHYTHTDASAVEVLCRILPESAWGTNTTIKAEVVRVETAKGNMHIDEGCFVLSATGDKQSHLTALTPRQTLTLRISSSINNTYADFKAALGGQDRTFMLVNGVVDNNWDENHPRTGLGYSVTGDTIIHCVVDGRGKSLGATTGVLAEIMQHYGAYNAMNMEGGGSSTMYLMLTGVMNATSDGYERAESQGIFAVSSAPDDDAIARIAPLHPVVHLPKYGVLSPTFLGYNQYDLLLNMDVADVRLSCDPSVGYFDDQGRFVCLQSGVLHAALGDILTTIDIRLIDSAPINIRLDSVLCGAGEPYTIEVQGYVNDEPIDLLSEALQWQSMNTDVLEVDHTGTILPVANGTTQVIGRLGDFQDTIHVTIEIPDNPILMWDDFSRPDEWIVTASAGFDPTILVPTPQQPEARLHFTFKKGRALRIDMQKEAPFYSVPHTIRLTLTTQAIFERVEFAIRANNSDDAQMIVLLPEQQANTPIDIVVPVAEVFGTDAAIFPLHCQSLSLKPWAKNAVGEYDILLSGIELLYGDDPALGVEHIVHATSASKVLINNQIRILVDGKQYTILGQEIQ